MFPIACIASRPSGIPLWTPLDLGSALVAWYDPGDSSTVTQSGGLVSQLSDKSGNGNHLTATGTARPTYSSTSFQSHIPGITFNGTTNFLKNSSISLNVSAYTAFLFGQLSLTDTFPERLLSIFGNGATSDTDNIGSVLLIGTVDGNKNVGSKRNNVSSFLPFDNARLQPGVYFRFGALNDGTNQKFLTDGIVRDTDAVAGSLGSPVSLGLGARPDGNFPWPGIMGELILMNRAATASEIAQIDTYLLRNWRRVVVAEGDSVTWAPPTGANISFVYRFIPNSVPQSFVMNLAVPGTDFETNAGACLIDRVSALDATIPADKRGRQYVLFFTFANNINGAIYTDPLTNPTAAQKAARIGAFCQARKAVGWDKVVIATFLSRTDGQANDTFRNAINAVITTPGWKETYGIDAICDFAADSIMGVNASQTLNPSYWLDSVHPNAAGHARLEPIFTSAINGL